MVSRRIETLFLPNSNTGLNRLLSQFLDAVHLPLHKVADTESTMVSKAFGALGRFFITTGIVILLFVGYQLWGTGLQEASAQNNLGSDFDELLGSVEIPAAPTTSTTSTTIAEAPAPTTTVPEAGGAIDVLDDPELAEKLFREGGEAVAEIRIPQIEVEKYIVQGVQVEDLRNGPGHYRATVFPGQEGNSGIAGHRTTYGAPFNRIDELLPGDEFEVTTIQGVHTYRVMSAQDAFNDEIRGTLGPDFVLPENAAEIGHIIVAPTATWVLGNFGDNRITLTACHPKFSAAQRIIVAAELVSAPAGTVVAPDGYNVTDGGLVSEDLSAEELALEAGEGVDPDDLAAAPTDTGSGTPDTAAFADEVTLDEGLNGEKDALRPAIIYGLIAIALYLGFKELARRWKPWPALILGIAPVVFFMALTFEKVDRYLPAG